MKGFTMHSDFVGNKLAIGDFVAYPGGGNSKREYGLILRRILELKPDGSIITERLEIRNQNIVKIKSTIKSLTKIV